MEEHGIKEADWLRAYQARIALLEAQLQEARKELDKYTKGGC